MKKILCLIFIICLLFGKCYADEVIADFSEGSLPVLNEILRNLNNSAIETTDEKVKASSTDTSAGYLDAKVAKSVVINSNHIETVIHRI